MARQILSLVLLLTQAVTTFAAPAFTVCISPKGHVCIDAPWTVCTCCQEESDLDQADQCRREASGDDKVCQSENRCSCRCDHADSPPAAMSKAPNKPDPAVLHGQPCRCKHIPLLVTQDGQQPAIERTSVVDRHSFDNLMPAASVTSLVGFSTARNAVALLPQPPPSGHLLTISCTVLRC